MGPVKPTQRSTSMRPILDNNRGAFRPERKPALQIAVVFPAG